MNAGIKKFKVKDKAGVTKEFTQMHDMNVFRPIEVESLTYDKKKKALSSLMFLKEKRDSLVKARMCADRCKQKDGKLVFITAVIDSRNRGCTPECPCAKKKKSFGSTYARKIRQAGRAISHFYPGLKIAEAIQHPLFLNQPP